MHYCSILVQAVQFHLVVLWTSENFQHPSRMVCQDYLLNHLAVLVDLLLPCCIRISSRSEPILLLKRIDDPCLR